MESIDDRRRMRTRKDLEKESKKDIKECAHGMNDREKNQDTARTRKGKL